MDTTLELSESLKRSYNKVYTRYRKQHKNILLEQPLTHRRKWAVFLFDEMVEEGKFKGAFKDSDLSDLAIVAVNNYDEKTLLEKGLDYFGVTDYTVLKHDGEWRMTYKYLYLLEFIEECDKPYILYCDSRDVLFMDDPAKVMPLFKEFKCEAVFNSTMSPRGIFKRYPSVYPLYFWSRYIGRTGWRKRFANAGLFIGKKQFIKEICEVMLFYCERMDCRYQPTSDQDVLRAIYPWLWPRMMVDYYNKISYRN